MATSPEEEAMKKRLFVAVHAGAGFHSEDKASEYKKLCKKACLEAMAVLNRKGSAVDAVTAAVSNLEDCELTNAGRGSSLTMTGCVECDASVMEGTRSLFGGVGCLSGVRNPILVAQRLLQGQQEPTLSLGRIPPSVLVGKGAREWAEQQGIVCGSQDKLITDRSRRLHRKYKRKVELTERDNSSKKARFIHESTPVSKIEMSPPLAGGSQTDKGACCESMAGTSHRTEMETQHSNDIQKQQPSLLKTPSIVRRTTAEHDQDHRSSMSWSDSLGAVTACEKDENVVQDTVGALCIDWKGNISAAVSSGGIWLKQPGRLGPAAIYGAACWAQDAGETEPGVGVIASGCGEHLMRTLLAKSCADCLLSAQDSNEGLNLCIKKHFLESRLLSGVKSRLVGAVAVLATLTQHGIPDIDLCWGHTTESMALGYMTGDCASPTTLISRLSEDCEPGLSFTMSGHFFSNLASD